MTTLVSLGDAGLDRVLGGGLPIVDRGAGRPNSVVLIRGPAGAGKTLFAARVAWSLARQSSANILWACVEILPAEVRAQLEGLTDAGLPSVYANSLYSSDPAAVAPAIIAESLEIDDGAAPTAKVDLAERLLKLLHQLQHRQIATPTVIVVDSLAVGYHIGADIDRRIADGLCKMAHARGISLVLVEESDLREQSLWTFAVDAVFELDRRPKPRERGVSFSREIVIAKNRFGFANVGPHQLQLSSRGSTVLPSPGSYGVEPGGTPTTSGAARFRAAQSGKETKLPLIAGRLLSIVGPEVAVVRRVAQHVLAMHPINIPLLALELGAPVPDLSDLRGAAGAARSVSLSHPFLTPHEILARATDALQAVGEQQLVLVGDLGVVDGFGAADEVHRALAAWCGWVRSRGCSIVAFNSRAQESIVQVTSGARAFSAPGSSPAPTHAIADLQLEVRTVPTQPSDFVATLTESATGLRWTVSEVTL
jgi:KaiC/GvpD/RAD55 family RecA-like ATPase